MFWKTKLQSAIDDKFLQTGKFIGGMGVGSYVHNRVQMMIRYTPVIFSPGKTLISFSVLRFKIKTLK